MNDNFVNPIIRNFVRSQPDITIDKYSGEGSFGELYFGNRIILKDRVALKFYKIGLLGINHNEPQLLKTINHENILEIYDAKILNNQFAYYLTPEISGGDLQNHIQNHIIDTETAFSVIQGILKGLNELHKAPNNFVHRDLKTLNILIDKFSKKPYISDFGTLKQIPNNTNYVSASKYTLLYKPAEVILNGHYYIQSDIYQVGIILYQLLGGFFPFNQLEWMNQKQNNKYANLPNQIEQVQYFTSIIDNLILKGKILNLSSLPNYVDLKLKKILNKATHPVYTKRYSTCSEFLKDIFDYTKNSKNWWLDNDIYFACNKTKTKYYKIEKLNKDYSLQTSRNLSNWRTKNLNTNKLIEIISHVSADK